MGQEKGISKENEDGPQTIVEREIFCYADGTWAYISRTLPVALSLQTNEEASEMGQEAAYHVLYRARSPLLPSRSKPSFSNVFLVHKYVRHSFSSCHRPRMTAYVPSHGLISRLWLEKIEQLSVPFFFEYSYVCMKAAVVRIRRVVVSLIFQLC